jgi:uncharacterized protein
VTDTLSWEGGTVSVAWDRPSIDAKAVVVLAHGAGGDMNDALLRVVSRGLSEKGAAVLRFNFPYREAGRKAPGAQSASEACYRAIADEARTEGVPLFLGGKSYGGRMASHIVADGYEADGLTFISYPLHPPGRPEKLRDEHLGRIGAPMLFVQGTKDPFATPELLQATVARLSNARLASVERGDHSLRVSGRKPADVASFVVEEVDAFIDANSN